MSAKHKKQRKGPMNASHCFAVVVIVVVLHAIIQSTCKIKSMSLFLQKRGSKQVKQLSPASQKIR